MDAKLLEKLSDHPDWRVRARVAEREDTPPDLLTHLAQDENPNVCTAVASNPRTPLPTLRLLSKSRIVQIREGVARNPSCSPDLLLHLGKSRHAWVRSAVAGNPNTPKDLLLFFVWLEKDQVVRSRAIKNPSTPPEALRKLAEGPKAWSEVALAIRPWGKLILIPSVPWEVRMVMVHWGEEIRLALAQNPSTPEDVLTQLAEVEGKDSYFALKAHLALAQNPSTPPEVLLKLAEARRGVVRASVAQNPSLPLEALKHLAEDKDEEVRIGVVKNPNAPREVLNRLAEDGRPHVRQSAWAHPKFPFPQAVDLFLKEEKAHIRDKRLAKRFLENLENLPQEFNLWMALWEEGDPFERAVIQAHPFGAQIALLARLGR